MGLHIIVLAGGSGTRLWPLSRRSTPKHLLPLARGGETLLRATVDRVIGLGEASGSCRPSTRSTGASPRSRISAWRITRLSLSRSPVGRASSWTAVGLIAREDPGALIASVHADHRVSDPGGVSCRCIWPPPVGRRPRTDLRLSASFPWHLSLDSGMSRLASVGPRNYGSHRSSIQCSAAAAALPAFKSPGFRRNRQRTGAGLRQRREAPVEPGTLAWTARRFLDELRIADPELSSALAAAVAARVRGDEDEVIRIYGSQSTQAVEPLVLEHTPRLTVVEATFGWSDLGSWTDVHDARVAEGDVDADGNVLEGQCPSLRHTAAP